MEIDPDMVANIQNGMAFAADFANAILKLKRADEQGRLCTLSAKEVKATLQGFRLLKDAHKKGR